MASSSASMPEIIEHKHSAPVWDHFDKVRIGTDLKAKCRHCSKLLATGGNSTLVRHIKSCLAKQARESNQSQLSATGQLWIPSLQPPAPLLHNLDMFSRRTVTITLLVDTTRNRVIFADCGGDFVDIVLSCLTLPMASIIRLIGKDGMPVGSMLNIYRSVESLEHSYFRNGACKSMLLRPFDVAMAKLYSFLSISSAETPIFFYCYDCFSSRKIFSLYEGAQCSCGRNMSMSRIGRISNYTYSAVFVVGNFRYTITDDCMISKTSTNSVISLLQKLGSNRGVLVERKVEVNASHVVRLLKCCLTSHDTLLTDTFLTNGKVSSTLQPEADFFPGTQRKSSSLPEAIKLKLAINKRDKTVIFAEDNSDFVDLLSSFLCLPVACIVKLFDGQINFGCFQNLYKSVEALRLADCFVNKEMENMLTCPKSPPFSSIKNVQLIQVEESEPETLYVCSKFPSCSTDTGELAIWYKTCVCGRSADVPVNLQDPKQYPASESATGFLIRSAYVVSNNLSIKPLSCISVASFFLDGAVDGVEFITVDVGQQQALALLKSSITSKTALTDVLLRSNEPKNMVKREAAC